MEQPRCRNSACLDCSALESVRPLAAAAAAAVVVVVVVAVVVAGIAAEVGTDDVVTREDRSF